jgi:hypothetical protein
MNLDGMSKEIAQLHAKAESDLIAIAAPGGLHCAGRVRHDQVEGAKEFVENKLVARRDSLARRVGTGLKFS